MAFSTGNHKLDMYVHVPKTGGISLREQILKNYPPEKIYGYDPLSGRLSSMARQGAKPGQQNNLGSAEKIVAHFPGLLINTFLSLREKWISEPTEEALAKAAVIIGHFAVDTFDNFAETENARQFTVLRHPLERMDSHYRYLQQLGKLRSSIRHWSTGQNADQPFTSFALDEGLQNYQAQFVGADIGRFALVGVTERLPSFMSTIGLLRPGEEEPRLNPTAWGQPAKLLRDAGFIRTFEEFHAEDYRLYEEALELAP